MNQRVASILPILSPQEVIGKHPCATEAIKTTVSVARKSITDILHGRDDRLVVMVGPCSIHDTESCLEYARKLNAVRVNYKDTLLVVMRVYFEKPRTITGWKGFINDPHLDDTCDINAGLVKARKLMGDINAMGLPVATEFLDTVTPQYIADLVAWGAIGARTTESQLHRQLASGLSMPIGFKNSTTGNIKVAVEGAVAASYPHCFIGVDMDGGSSIVTTSGNCDTHVILRGGSDTGPQYSEEWINSTSTLLSKYKTLSKKILVDCSHGNSEKDYTKQFSVCENVAEQVARGNFSVMGVMIESHLVEGKQSISPDMVYGQSITDGCVSFSTTIQMLDMLAKCSELRQTIH